MMASSRRLPLPVSAERTKNTDSAWDGADSSRMPMDEFAARTSDAIDLDHQNSYVCEAMEGVSISSPSLPPKVRNKEPPRVKNKEPATLSRPKKPIPPPLVLRDDAASIVTNSLLTEFAIIATSPRSPLMQKHLPIRKRAYSFSSMETLHSYARQQPLTPPPGLLSPPSSMSCSSLNSSAEEIQNGMSPVSTPGRPDVAYRWPIAVWQCFLKGVRVQILSVESMQHSSWLLVDEIQRKAEKNCDLSQYAPNGLRLLDACNYPRSDTAATMLQLRFEPVEPVPYPQPTVLVEFVSDHPFFVKDKGWSSAHTELTARTYGIPCRALQPADICLPPSHPEATFTSDIYESVKSYDFTPEDTSAVFALSSMAKKQMQSVIVSAAAMSPPISPVKKCIQTATIPTAGAVVVATAAIESAKPKRPMNGFMLFAKKYRIQYTHMYPGKDNRAISVLLGDTWKRMTNEERGIYSLEARIMAEEQKKLHPDCWKRRRSSIANSKSRRRPRNNNPQDLSSMGKKHRKLKWKPLPFQQSTPEESAEVNATGRSRNTRLRTEVQAVDRLPTGSNSWKKTKCRAFRKPLPSTGIAQNLVERFDGFKSRPIPEELVEAEGGGSDWSAHQYFVPFPFVYQHHQHFRGPFYPPNNNLFDSSAHMLVPSSTELDLGSTVYADDIGSSAGHDAAPFVFPVPGPFLFRPCATHSVSQYGYPFSWTNSRGGGERRGRRGGRTRIGGEGISYDRWPSRKKPRDTIELQTQMDIEETLPGPGSSVVQEENGNQTEAKMQASLDVFAADLVGSMIKVVLDGGGGESAAAVENKTDLKSAQQAAVFTDVDLLESTSNQETYMKTNDDDDDQKQRMDTRWTSAQKALTDEDSSNGSVRRPCAATTRDVSKYYKLCSSEVDDVGVGSSFARTSLGGEIVIHELDDDASECGSEDVEMFGHRYETSATAEERRYKSNQMSLASEIMNARQQGVTTADNLTLQMPPISVESDEPGCYTNTQALEGYYGQMRRPAPPKRSGDRPVSDVLDSGIHTSDDDDTFDEHRNDDYDDDDEILFARKTMMRNQRAEAEADANFSYQPIKSRPRPAAELTRRLVYMKSDNSWYNGCCAVM